PDCVTMWHAPEGSIVANGGGYSNVVMCQNTHLPASECKCASHMDKDGRVNANLPLNGQSSLPGFQGPPAQSGPPPKADEGSKETGYKWKKHNHAPQMVI